MPRLELHALSGLRDEAAALLAERFARQRESEPLLPDVDDFEAHVPADGLVATCGGEALAYLADEPAELTRPSFAGHAARDPEALRDLFAELARRSGASRFAVAVPAADPALLDAWFRLAFGCQLVWGVRQLEAAAVPAFRGEIRRSGPGDLAAAAALDRELSVLQAAAPSFSGRETQPLDAFVADWSTLLDEPQYVHFVAAQDSAVIGHLLLYRRPDGDLRVPERNIDLALAGTRSDRRGAGVGLALYAHATAWALEHGYRSMTVDWRSVNLLSSRFWPRRGFRPQYLRLYRAVP